MATKKVTIEECYRKEEIKNEANVLLHELPTLKNIVKLFNYIKEYVVQNGISCVNNLLILELCPLGNLPKYVESA